MNKDDACTNEILKKLHSKEFILQDNTENVRSEVWKSFQKVFEVKGLEVRDTQYVICTKCMKYSYKFTSANGTSSLKHHLKKSCFSKPSEQTCSDCCKGNDERCYC